MLVCEVIPETDCLGGSVLPCSLLPRNLPPKDSCDEGLSQQTLASSGLVKSFAVGNAATSYPESPVPHSWEAVVVLLGAKHLLPHH